MEGSTRDLLTYIDADLVNQFAGFVPTARSMWDTHPERSKYGLGSDTGRAIPTGAAHGSNEGPVAVFDAWAESAIELCLKRNGLPQQLRTAPGFEKWHAELALSVDQFWSGRVRAVNAMRLAAHDSTQKPFKPAVERLAVAHKYKLVDLMVKALRLQREKAPWLAEAAWTHGHIPLDRKSLAVISACFGGIGMATAFSMGNVKSERHYRTYQNLAMLVCKEVGAAPMALDFFALHHPEAVKLWELPKRPKKGS